MSAIIPNHYATLGLDRHCAGAQIRTAYRLLAKQHHPDVNANSPAAIQRTQELNAAYECLSDPARRQNYDRELTDAEKRKFKIRTTKTQHNFAQDIQLRLEDFLRGAALEVRVKDPANANALEIYPLTVPPNTAPGTRFKIARSADFGGGFIVARVKAAADFCFKIRGSDLRCDLRIMNQLATQGGAGTVRGLAGKSIRILIPRGIGRDETICIPDEGLPKPRGGRGDLWVRIIFRPEIRITRR